MGWVGLEEGGILIGSACTACLPAFKGTCAPPPHTHRGHAVLPRPRLCDDALLAHALGQQRLPQGVVDFVGACVVQVLALQVDVGVRAVGPGECAAWGRGVFSALLNSNAARPSPSQQPYS